MANNNVLSNLALCRKAGLLIFGFDAAVEEIKKRGNKVAGVVAAADLSEKTLKELRFHCDKHGKEVVVIGENMDGIGRIAGKKTGVVAVLDGAFFKKFK